MAVPESWVERMAAMPLAIQSRLRSELRFSKGTMERRDATFTGRLVQPVARRVRMRRASRVVRLQNTRLHREELFELWEFVHISEFRIFHELVLFLEAFLQAFSHIGQCAIGITGFSLGFGQVAAELGE